MINKGKETLYIYTNRSNNSKVLSIDNNISKPIFLLILKVSANK